MVYVRMCRCLLEIGDKEANLTYQVQGDRVEAQGYQSRESLLNVRR